MLECMFERICAFQGRRNKQRAKGLCSSHLAARASTIRMVGVRVISRQLGRGEAFPE
jgi:hypothetical protein